MAKTFENLNILKEIKQGIDGLDCRGLFEEVAWELRARGRRELQAQRAEREPAAGAKARETKVCPGNEVGAAGAA